METIALILIAIFGALFTFIIGQKLAGKPAQETSDHNADAMTGLKAQLELLAQQASTSQAQMAEQMRNQEAMLSKRLEEQLGSMSERMSQNLQKTNAKHT